MLITTFVFIGIEGASVYSRYAKKREDVGRATVLGFLSVLSIFALVTLSSYSVVPQPELADTRQPSMVGVFESVVGDWGEVFISVAVIVSVLGAYLAWTLMAAEVMYIPARADDFPEFLGQENEAGTPITALVVTSLGVQALLALTLFVNDALNFMLDLCHQPGAAALPARGGVRPQARSDRGVLRGRLGRGCGARRRSSRARPRRTRSSSSTPPGLKFVLLSTVILAPAALLYVKARSEHGRRLFSPAEIGLFALIVVGGDHRRRRPRGPAASPSEPTDRKATHHDRAPSPRRTASTPRSAGCARSWSAHPGLAHRRLTPTNTDDLLFDDVMWVENAQRDHADFVNKLTQRGVEVVELHDVLAQTMAIPGARDWLLDRKIVAQPGRSRARRRHPRLPRVARAAPSSRSTSSAGWRPPTCPRTSGPATSALARESTGAREYLMPPLPNTLYTRDTTCWLYGGLTMNPLYWPARQGRDAALQGDLRVPPGLRRLDGLVGRPRAGLGPGDVRGRRHHAGRQRRRADGHERADLAAGDHPGRGGAVRAGRGRARRRRRHAQAAGRDAPRHGLHLRRPRHRHALPDDHGRASTPSRCCPSDTAPGVEVDRRGLDAVRRRRRRGARACRRCR